MVAGSDIFMCKMTVMADEIIEYASECNMEMIAYTCASDSLAWQMKVIIIQVKTRDSQGNDSKRKQKMQAKVTVNHDR